MAGYIGKSQGVTQVDGYTRSETDALLDAINVYDAATDSTGFFALPKGTTAQRPGSPAEGYTRYNTDNDVVEVYAEGAWVAVGDQSANTQAEYLIVAGGGAGGSGGGGAGGVLTSYASSTVYLITGNVYTATVGGGATGVVHSANPAAGTDSSFTGINFTLTAFGGGGGGGFQGTYSPDNGGSGGGAGWQQTSNGSGTNGQGNDGGVGTGGDDAYITSGGGGAGAVGGNANNSTNVSGAGGVGLQVNIDGNNYYWGGGGGGGSQASPYTGGAGGLGGGGGGGNYNSGAAGVGGGSALNSGQNGIVTATTSSSAQAGGNGGANTGGGGGGDGQTVNISGAGGSGVVILRMPTSRYTGTVTGSPTVSTDGSDTILTFTSSGTYTA